MKELYLVGIKQELGIETPESVRGEGNTFDDVPEALKDL